MPARAPQNFFGGQPPQRRRQRRNFLAQLTNLSSGGSDALRLSKLKGLEYRSLADEVQREMERGYLTYQEMVSSPEDISPAYRKQLIEQYAQSLDKRVSGYQPENEYDAKLVQSLREEALEGFKLRLEKHDSALTTAQKRTRAAQEEQAESTRYFGRAQRELSRAREAAEAGIQAAFEEWQDSGSVADPDFLPVIGAALSPVRESLDQLKGSMNPDEYERINQQYISTVEEMKSRARVASDEAGRQAHNGLVMESFRMEAERVGSPDELAALKGDIPDAVKALQGVDNRSVREALEKDWQRLADTKASEEFRRDPFSFDYASWSGVMSDKLAVDIANGMDQQKQEKAKVLFDAAIRGLSVSERKSNDFDSIVESRQETIAKAREALGDEAVARRMSPEAIGISLNQLSDAEVAIAGEARAREDFMSRLSQPHLGPLDSTERKWANTYYANALGGLPEHQPGASDDERAAIDNTRVQMLSQIVRQTAGLDIKPVKDFLESLAYDGIAGGGSDEAGAASVEVLRKVVQSLGSRNANVVYDQLPESLRGQVREYVRYMQSGGDSVTPTMGWAHVTRKDRDVMSQARMEAYERDYSRTDASKAAAFNAVAIETLNDVLGADYDDSARLDAAVIDRLRFYTEDALSRNEGLTFEDAIRVGARQLSRSGMGVDPATGMVTTTSPRVLFSKPGDQGEEYKARISYAMQINGADFKGAFDESKLRAITWTDDDGVPMVGFRELDADGVPVGDIMLREDGSTLAIPMSDITEKADKWVKEERALLYGGKNMKGLYTLEEELRDLHMELVRGAAVIGGPRDPDAPRLAGLTPRSGPISRGPSPRYSLRMQINDKQLEIRQRETQLWRHQFWMRSIQPDGVDTDANRIYTDEFSWRSLYGGAGPLDKSAVRFIEPLPEAQPRLGAQSLPE